MNATTQVACEICGQQPCPTPGFCESCRRADAQRRRQRTAPNPSRPTPQSIIEAIIWCVRERGVQALHESANIERLFSCDLDARTEINRRIARLLANKEIAT
jgi:hypothetical protein